VQWENLALVEKCPHTRAKQKEPDSIGVCRRRGIHDDLGAVRNKIPGNAGNVQQILAGREWEHNTAASRTFVQ
jgi:hypothetical protein